MRYHDGYVERLGHWADTLLGVTILPMTSTAPSWSEGTPAAERVLVLSPHPDDAVWSIGSLIADLAHGGAEVAVVSLFTAVDEHMSEAGNRWFKDSGFAGRSAATVRHEEDRRALEILGARLIHIGLLDAVSRCPDRYFSPSSLAGQSATVDRRDPGPTQCNAAVQNLLVELAPTTVLVPLGHGRHVDHQIVSATPVTGSRVLLYGDFPYTVLDPFVVGDRFVALQADKSAKTLWHTPSASAVRQHVQAAQAYSSQVDAFFGSAAALRTQLGRHLNHQGRKMIRLVQPSSSAPT